MPRLLVQRISSVLLVAVAVPALIGLGTFSDDQPIRIGEPAPRTVVAEDTIRVVDEDATETARRVASESVEPVVTLDPEAQSAIVTAVRDVFRAARDARRPIATTPEPGATESAEPPTRTPSEDEQVTTMLESIDVLDEEALRRLAQLSGPQLSQVEADVVGVSQQIARLRMSEEDMNQMVSEQLGVELAVRNFPGDLETELVEPLIRAVAQPTLQVDPDATAAARERAAEAVEPITRVWQPGEPIVQEGVRVEPLAFEALEQLGLEGAGLLVTLLRALAAMVLTGIIAAAYLWRMQPKVWGSGRKILLLASLVTGFAAAVAGVDLLTAGDSVSWWYVVPAGALAMLTAILVHPVVGISTMLPAVVLILVTAPVSAGVAVFVAATVLVAVPLTTRLSSRHELRQATLRIALASPAIALVTVAVFGPRDQLPQVVGAAAINGLVTAMLVQGLLPFLENLFRLPTVTALLDLADRNHPLLRELEQKAIGSYNHSVMVASLVERACRQIGADALLGQVAALYHDIGKVRRPYYFIENQQGIANPHDELTPEVSAVIIQEHVVDGVKMAKEYRLPPEVVAAIGSHHGTMIVTYFYRKAVEAAGSDHVDEDHFRYKGSKPKSKEAAILLVADCCEATTRSMAMHRGNLPREEIESTVDHLIEERVEDGQFTDADLTFAELSAIRDSIVEALVGIYHPRIAYPAAALDTTATVGG